MEIARKIKANQKPAVSQRIRLDPEKAYERIPFSVARKIYRWDSYLGCGGFGQVVEARCKDKSDPQYGQRVALKFQANETEREKAMNLDEVSLLMYCKHPNIVRVFRVLEVRSEVWMAMELLRGGNLKQASTSKAVPFTEAEIAYVARETLCGIRYLHEVEVAHRDLKNLNIMLSLDGGVKLIDFGLAADMSQGPRVQMVGSPLWMAPEMIRGEEHSFGVDIWSFVVCMLELANQRPPNGDNVKRAMFISATVGMQEVFVDPDRWSKVFEVCFVCGTKCDFLSKFTL